MSYDRALQLLKTRSIEPAPVEQVLRGRDQGLDPQMPDARQAAWARAGLSLSALGFVVMAVLDLVILSPIHGRAFAVLLPMLMLFWAIGNLSTRDLGRQMFVRAVAWSSLLIGVVVSTWGLRVFSWTGPAIAIGAGITLLALRGRGLGLSSGSFRPLAFRGHLLLAAVMAMADAQTLLFSGIVDNAQIFVAGPPPGVGLEFIVPLAAMRMVLTPPLWCGLIMAIAAWGIVRLRTWALLLNILANVAIAALALGESLSLSLPVAAMLATTAAVQVLLSVPILASAFGDKTPDRPPLGRRGARLARLLLVALMGLSVVGLALPNHVSGLWRVGWVGTGAAHDVRQGSRPEPSLYRARGFRMGDKRARPLDEPRPTTNVGGPR
ncbi:MAG: hypothetical protein AAF799_28450 [Myxococcota bacterium]